MTNEKTLTKSDLGVTGGDFTDTSLFHRHSINEDIHYTDGVDYVAKIGGLYWLLDEIVLKQQDKKISNEQFQIWTLSVDTKNQTGTLTCEGEYCGIIFERKVEHIDFPLDYASLWFSGNIICLPSEH